MKKIIIYLIIAIIATAGIIELVIRVKGYKPFMFEQIDISIKPEWMYVFDSTIALKLKPGVFDITELKEYHYNATIDSSGYRVNATVDSSFKSINKDSTRQLIFLGAGSTFGQGLSDKEAYVFVLQTLLPQYTIRNQAVMGYGVANNYIQLMNLKNYKKGDLVIYIYHADQDNRNSFRNQKGSLNIFSKNPNFENFHYITLDSNLNTHLHKFNYKLWPLSSDLASVNFLEDYYNDVQDERQNYNTIARKAILAMNKRCEALQINFWIVCWKSDKLSLKTLDYLRDKGVKCFHIPTVIGFGHIPKEQIAPANRAFADSLYEKINLGAFKYL